MLSKHIGKSDDGFPSTDRDQIDYIRRKKVFGELVTSLRKARKWNRETFSRKISLDEGGTPLIPVRTIIDIERGEKAFLDYLTVTRLANAFDLQGLVRDEFFGYAGLSRVEENPRVLSAEQEQLICSFYKGCDYPAYVHDPLLNLHSANSCTFAGFGIKLDPLATEMFASCRGNLLLMLFDPRLTSLTTWVKGQQWRLHMERLVYTFRILSKNYVGSSSYVNLLRELKMRPEFPNVWATVEDPEYSPQFPVPTRFSLRTGEELDFIIMSNYDAPLLVSNLSRVVFIPFNDQTKEQLAKIMANIPRMYVKIDPTQPQQFVMNPL